MHDGYCRCTLRQSFYASNHLLPVSKNISTKYKVDGAPTLEA